MSAKFTTQQKQGMKSKTDWGKLKLMSEKQIIASAKLDPDAPPLSKRQLKKFKRVSPALIPDVRQIRINLHLSQKKFADYFGVSVRTIQEWEQHRRIPTATARNFLKVIEQAPQVVQKALS